MDINISYNSPDQDWDDFLIQIPGDHYPQSSLWAKVNETVGWQTIRITFLQDTKIVAGVQILIKKTTSVAVIGYVIKGPVFGVNDPKLRESLFCELSKIARQNQICFVALQPPNNATWLNELSELGLRPSNIKMEPTSTVLIDLSLNQDSLLAQMRTRTRYNIHLSSRKGIIVREGSANDLDTYYDLLKSTSQRQQFQIYPKQFFTNMYDILNSRNHIKIFLSEFKGNIISAQLILVFGDTVVNKMSVWSGLFSDLKPNEALLWYSILWSKKHGFHYYNLEGIGQEAASAIINNEPIPDTLKHSYSTFKLGFGGRVVQLPGVYEYIYNRAIRQFYDNVLDGTNNLF